MKNKASDFLKQIISLLSSIAKGKSMALKSKTSALKARLLMPSLTERKKIDQSKAIVLYNAMANESSSSPISAHLVEKVEAVDLRHSLLDEEDEGAYGSVIEMVRNSKEEEGEDFRLEDEIDQVADLFITRFHKQMRMQKLESFKRYQEMLQRSV